MIEKGPAAELLVGAVYDAVVAAAGDLAAVIYFKERSHPQRPRWKIHFSFAPPCIHREVPHEPSGGAFLPA